MNNNKSENISLKTITIRLISVQEALKRTRFIFIVMTIASSAILFTSWNDRFSRDKDLAFDSASYSETEIKQDRPEPLHVHGRKELVAEWYKNRIIQIGLLGIRLSVSDLSLIGSFTLVVITIWFYYGQKRENNALVTLLGDVHKEYKDDLGIRNMVYQGIKHSLIFIKTEPDDKPLTSLDYISHNTTSNKTANEDANADKNATERENSTIKHRSFTDKVLRFLAYLPFWAILAIIMRDFSALFMKSPTTSSDRVLGLILWEQVKWGSVGELWKTAYPIFLIIIFDSFAIGCAIYTRILCNKSRAFSEGSKKVLLEFEEALKQDQISN